MFNNFKLQNSRFAGIQNQKFRMKFKLKSRFILNPDSSFET